MANLLLLQIHLQLWTLLISNLLQHFVQEMNYANGTNKQYHFGVLQLLLMQTNNKWNEALIYLARNWPS